MKLNKYGLKELTKLQKKAFLNYAIKYYKGDMQDNASGYVICQLFRSWFLNKKLKVRINKCINFYILFTFPELAEAIYKRLLRQDREFHTRHTNHTTQHIGWKKIKEGKLTFSKYRLNFLTNFKNKTFGDN